MYANIIKNPCGPATARAVKTGLQPVTLACLVLLLGACAGGGNDGSTGGGPNGPQVIGSITSENAVPLARASLEMTSKLIAVGHIATAMVREHLDLLSGQNFDTSDIAQCAGSPDGYDVETNQISYRQLSPGFTLPGGPSLHIALSNCTIEGMLIGTGFIDVAAISFSGDPTGPGDWSLQAVLALSPVEILHANGTGTSLTDRMNYTVTMNGGVLTTTLDVAADANLGLIGGLNAQHYTAPLTAFTPKVNYQFRPFRMRTVEDAGAETYSVTLGGHPEGASTLHRYVGNGDSGIKLRISTTNGLPILWQGGRPAHYTDMPASGEVRLEAACSGCGSVVAAVSGLTVGLIIEAGPSILTQFTDWATLLSTPSAP